MEEANFFYPIRKKNSKLKWVILMGLAACGIVGGLFIFRQPQKIQAEKMVTTPVKYKQLLNSPTSKPTKHKENVTIQILNGSGTPGQARLIVKALVVAGYGLDNIKSGNAETFGGNVTTITSRADFEEIVSNIKDVLKPVYPDIADGVLNPNPNEDTGFDIVIITGSKTTVIATPTVNP